MKTQTWVVTTDLQLARPLSEDELVELVDQLVEHQAAVSLGRDALLSVTLDVKSSTYAGAAKAALTAVQTALPPGTLEGAAQAALQQVKVQTIEDQERELREPTIPDLVGYAEIAEIAGVSRQRARAFEKVSGFPVAVVETAAGPLRVRSAVEEWAKTRNTKDGRRVRADMPS